MRKLNSVVTTIRIRVEHIQKINESEMNLSEFVRDKLDEEFENSETLAEKEKELLSELKELKNKKKIVKRKEKTLKETPVDEEKWLQGAKKRVNESPGELSENCRVYNQQFGKRVSTTKFQELIE